MPLHPRVDRRLLIGALALALVGGSSVSARTPGPAGSPSLSIVGTIGVPCITVTRASGATTSDPLSIEQRRGGTLIATKTVPAPVPAESIVCLKPMRTADTLPIAQAGQERTATVPLFTAVMNPTTDTVSGSAEGTGTVVIVVRPRVGPILSGLFTPSTQADVDVNETYAATVELDLRRGDQVATRKSFGIDHWTAIAPTTTFTVQPGSAVATGTAAVDTKVTATLRAKDGTVRGRFSVRTSPMAAKAGTYRGTFKHAGKAVKVRAGDRVSVTGLSGAYTVPAGTLKETAGDTLTTKCLPAARWMAALDGNWFASGTADDGGTISGVGVSDARPGSIATLACEGPSGWRIMRAVTIQ